MSTIQASVRKAAAKNTSPDVPREKSRIQRANESKIIEAALLEFSRHGFRGATIDKIAQNAQLSKPNLLYYFKTKEDLYVEALNHVLDIWLAPLEGLDPDSTPEEALGKYIEKKMEMARDHPEASRMFAMEVLEGAKIVRPVLEDRLTQLTKAKKSVLAKWSREGKLANIQGTHLIFLIWSVTQHYADFEAQIDILTGKTLNNEQFFNEATKAIKDIIFHGVLR